ncbi:hypothetical protein F5Y03DRAFT_398123 [Xylaria venustula]|nr:hypothetical protein F5Y03DRAFT_398123 [Xylaria venustula]
MSPKPNGKGSEPLVPEEQDNMARDENDEFAAQLVQWFNGLAAKDKETAGIEDDGFPEWLDIFSTICNERFHYLADKVNGSASDSRLTRLAPAVEGVQYLGRLYAACITFLRFCKSEEQKGYRFKYAILPFEEDEWTGASYLQKIQSWSEDLGLTDVNIASRTESGRRSAVDLTVEEQLEQVTKDGRNTAPVHCEIQLLTFFLRSGAPKCVDYFGYSKNMKDTHRKICPRWALPPELTLLRTNSAEGLKIAYDDMLSLLQHKAIEGTSLKSPRSFLQSSARITPWRPDQKPSSWAFSDNNIEAPHSEQIPLDRIPALYIPQDGSLSGVRNVTISIYEKPDGDYNSTSEISKFGSINVVFAFQLPTKDLNALYRSSTSI